MKRTATSEKTMLKIFRAFFMVNSLGGPLRIVHGLRFQITSRRGKMASSTRSDGFFTGLVRRPEIGRG